MEPGGTDKSARLDLRSAFKGFKLMLLESIFFFYYFIFQLLVVGSPLFRPRASRWGAGGPSSLSGAGSRSRGEAGAGGGGGAGLLWQIRATSLLRSHPRDGSELLP